MIDPDYALSYEEFMNKYKSNLQNNDITDEVKENMIATLLDIEDHKINRYKFLIEDIYVSLINFKNKELEVADWDSYQIRKFLNAIIYLRNDIDLNNNKKYWNLDNLCNEVYDKLKLSSTYGKYLSDIKDEDFNPKNILNIDYYLNRFHKYYGNKTFKEIIDLGLEGYL